MKRHPPIHEGTSKDPLQVSENIKLCNPSQGAYSHCARFRQARALGLIEDIFNYHYAPLSMNKHQKYKVVFHCSVKKITNLVDFLDFLASSDFLGITPKY